jgi:hypothetical protein
MPELGLRIELQPGSTIAFSGLHIHGGSAPIYKTPLKEGEVIYTRMTLVAYCPGHFFLGLSSWSFAADPLRYLVRIASELQNWECVLYTNDIE